MSDETTPEETIHLAWGANGAAIDVPDEATHWRVRLIPHRGGNPKVLRRGGLPLIIPITATVDMLREAVDGKSGLYRLDPCDENGRDIDDADFAVIEIESDDDQGDADDGANRPVGGVIGELLKTNREMAQTLMQALSTISAQQQIAPILDASAALIQAADGAGLPERSPIRRALVRPAPSPPNAPSEPTPFDKLVEIIAPFAPQLGALLMKKLSGDPDIAAAVDAQYGTRKEPPQLYERHENAPDDHAQRVNSNSDPNGDMFQ